jgi:hypothetical protein
MTTNLTIYRQERRFRHEVHDMVGFAVGLYCGRLDWWSMWLSLTKEHKSKTHIKMLEWSSTNAHAEVETRNRRFREEQAEHITFALEHAKIPAPKTLPEGWGPIKIPSR